MKLLQNVERAALQGWLVRDNGDIVSCVAIGQEITAAFWVVLQDGTIECAKVGYFKDKLEDAQGLALWILQHGTP